LVAVAALLAGCGDDLSEPSAEDRALAESALVSPESLEAAGVVPRQEFYERTLAAEACGRGAQVSACRCASDAIFAEISAAEFAVVSLKPGEPRKALIGAVGDAIAACAASGSPPASLGLEGIADEPVEITATELAEQQLLRSPDQAEVAFVRGCVQDSGATAASCQCGADKLLSTFDPYEVMVLGFHGPEALSASPYFRELNSACAEAG
jgi:hypothetical protein